nr:MAG TPA: hypothetical protein [Caudoviricetes sp.]
MLLQKLSSKLEVVDICSKAERRSRILIHSLHLRSERNRSKFITIAEQGLMSSDTTQTLRVVGLIRV